MNRCKKHGCEMEVIELIGFPDDVFCPVCELEKKRRFLEQKHIEVLHELGAVKVELKKVVVELEKVKGLESE